MQSLDTFTICKQLSLHQKGAIMKERLKTLIDSAVDAVNKGNINGFHTIMAELRKAVDQLSE